MSQQPYPHENASTHTQGQFGTTPYPPRDARVTPSAVSGDERAAAIVAHLSAPIAAIISAGSLSLVGPLIVWLLYRKRSDVVRQAAAGAFNFNLAWWILYLIGWIFFFTVVGILVAVPLWIAISVVALWCHIRGAMRAGDGQDYRYPFQLRVLS